MPKSATTTRRRFLQGALATSTGLGLSGLPGLVPFANAQTALSPVVVNLFMAGGPDMRHLLPPPFVDAPGSYGYEHWVHRARAQGIASNVSAYQSRWNNDYYHVAGGVDAPAFGILKRCGWLHSMWQAGKVAFVCNVVGATSRDHAHAISVMERGDVGAAPFERGSGWGGRLAFTSGGNSVALTNTPRDVCVGPDPNAPLDLLALDENMHVAAANMRTLNLYRNPTTTSSSAKDSTTRAVNAYYEAALREMSEESVYFRFVEHYRKLREFGEPIEERLSTVSVPAPIQQLLEDTVFDGYLARQIRNLHDAFVCKDILNLRVASLEYNGWDSHSGQRALIEHKLENLFGTGKALDAAHQSLAAIDGALENTVFVINGEFGRQLKDNGDAGTDHGSGNTVILIGDAVRGGVYGDMFPEEELTRLEELSPDIEGLTSIDHVFGAACDWASPGAKDLVFPEHAGRPLEAGVDLDSIFG